MREREAMPSMLPGASISNVASARRRSISAALFSQDR